MSIKKRVFFITVLVEIAVIGFLGYRIYVQRKGVLGTGSVHPIPAETIKTVEPGSSGSDGSNSALDYYYEPAAGRVVTNINDWTGYDAAYTINKDSLNDRYQYSEKKPPGVFRIITLGDSDTFGLYVDTADNWTELLEDRLNDEARCEDVGFEVLNLGVHGYDVRYSLERYKIRGRKYRPDMAIWLFNQGDISQLNEVLREKERKISEEMARTGEFDEQVAQGNLYPSWSRAYQETLDEIGIDEIEGRNRDWISEFIEIFPGDIVLMTFPSEAKSFRGLLRQLSLEYRNAYYFDGIINVDQEPEAFIPEDGHPSEEGHRRIADALTEYLLQQQDVCELYTESHAGQ